MSDDSLRIKENETESDVNKDLDDDLPIRCASNMLESKSEVVEEGELDPADVSSEDEEIDRSDGLDKKEDEKYLKELEDKLTQEEINMKWRQAIELKLRGNEEYKQQKYLDSVSTYTEALHICPSIYATERSILYANRAASNINIGNKKNALQDCTKSIQLNSTYVKAYLRRAKLYEELDKLDESLDDLKKVLDIDPSCSQAQTGSRRLESKLYEKNEKLKEEMLGKLKDLGNLVLRPFGLSTDNFKLEQNSETGGYSINFNQSGGTT